jgi:hypothetical protein
MVLAALALTLGMSASGQIVKTVFEDDFSGSGIDPSRYVPDTPFFEGGQGDITGTIGNGVLEFAGTTTQQWWSGGTLRLVPTFTASEEQSVVVSVDRVAEAGQGSASRSALWITEPSGLNYVLFADVRGEGGWRFNRKIGEAGDQPTGGGTDVAAFNLAEFDDGGLHRMRAVANGKTVRLYLDDVFGAEVKFPFQELVIQLGSFARATGDTAYTVFDDLLIQTVGTATFGTTALTLLEDQTSSDLLVRIPSGANATEAVVVRVVSANPSVAVPVGAVNGTLAVTFPSGGANTQTIRVQSLAVGSSAFTLESDLELAAGNQLAVTVVEAPGLRLEDDFAGATLNPAKWEVHDRGFEVGTGEFEVRQQGGRLEILGSTWEPYWGGKSARSVGTYTATRDLPLTVEVDRVSVTREPDEAPAAVRTGVFLSNADRTQYFFFGQNLGENGWQVNANATGAGTDLVVFNALDGSTGQHRLRLVANGEEVEVFLDGVSGGRFAWALSAGIHVELGAYARDYGDTVTGVFDQARVANALPCLEVTPLNLDLVSGEVSSDVWVTLPKLANTAAAASVTVTSSNPSVAVPEGGSGGVVVLDYAAGSTAPQAFRVRAVGVGSATFGLTGPEGVCVGGPVRVTVTPPPVTLFSDDFASGLSDTTWRVDETPLGAGVALVDESGISTEGGVVRMSVTAEVTGWPGFAVFTRETYAASASSPVTFEADRTRVEFQLVTGTAAKQRTGLWISDATRERYVFFSEFLTHDGSAGGWQYHRSLGEVGDTPVTGPGVSISAFGSAAFNDRSLHRMRAVADGATVKLYLDGVFGVEVPFPVGEGLVMGMGTYVEAGTDKAFGTFDHVTILGVGAAAPTLQVSQNAQGDLVLTWTGAAILESVGALAGETWAPVAPAPAGNTYTVPVAAMTGDRFYRLRQ